MLLSILTFILAVLLEFVKFVNVQTILENVNNGS